MLWALSLLLPNHVRRAPPVQAARAAVAARHPLLRAAAAESTLGKRGLLNEELVAAPDKEAVLGMVTERAGRMNAVNHATALHRLAALEKKNRAERDALLLDPRFEQLLDGVERHAAEMNPRSVADVLWSCATLRHWPPRFLKPVLTQVHGYLDGASDAQGQFEPRHLSIVTWAFAQLGCKPVRLLELIELRAREGLAGFNTQNCANLLWGFAKLQQNTSLLPAVSEHLCGSGLVAKCKPVEVSDLAYASAVLGTMRSREEAAPLLVELASRARSATALSQFSSRHLVTLVWSFSRLEVRPPEGCLPEWRAAVLDSSSRRPLGGADRRCLLEALGWLGESEAEWLPQPAPVAQPEVA